MDSFGALSDGRVKIFASMAGNLVAAMSDSLVAEEGIRKAQLSVQVATKLNRSHIVTAQESILLPALVRAERDEQAAGLQFVTAEDTVCRVNMSHGELAPVSPDVRSDVWILAELGKRVLAGTHPQIPWQAYQDDYDTIRDSRRMCSCRAHPPIRCATRPRRSRSSSASSPARKPCRVGAR